MHCRRERYSLEVFHFVDRRNPTCKPPGKFSFYIQNSREHNTENTVEQ